MSLKEKIADFIARGAIQLSRKYRNIGVPPPLEEGQTYLDKLRIADPLRWERLEELAKEEVTRKDQTTHLTLTYDEFNEWLRQTGRSPALANWQARWEAAWAQAASGQGESQASARGEEGQEVMGTEETKQRRVIAKFHPQAVINNRFVDVDPQGEQEFDVTELIEEMGKEVALRLKNNSYSTDMLMFAPSAPAWVQAWVGPFYIEVETSVRAYFEVDA